MTGSSVLGVFQQRRHILDVLELYNSTDVMLQQMVNCFHQGTQMLLRGLTNDSC